jgi:hypothetical protein
MMAWATSEDVEARLGRTLTTDEVSGVDGLLDEATMLVAEWLGCTPDPVPDAATLVVSRMVARSVQASSSGVPTDGANSVQATALSFAFTRNYSAAATSGGVWLARQDKMMLRRWRRNSMVINVSTAP